ncbi:MAG: UPF0182 family protein [Oscillospiraceae bacterium]|nr:UPF0182 family protein [Oscillospiraceae bacterium]
MSGNDDGNTVRMKYPGFKMPSLAGKKKLIIIIGSVVAAFIALRILFGIYLELLQLDEIGNYSSIFITNMGAIAIAFAICFAVTLIPLIINGIVANKYMGRHFAAVGMAFKKMPVVIPAIIVAILFSVGKAFESYDKFLLFFNSTKFGQADPIFGNDIGYYVFQRPFYMFFVEVALTACIVATAFTVAYYVIAVMTRHKDDVKADSFKVKKFIGHALVMVAVCFFVRAFTYIFKAQDLLFGTYFSVNGTGYVGVNIWINYFKVIPFVLVAIVLGALLFIWRSEYKRAVIVILAYPAIWIAVSAVGAVVQNFVVIPNEYEYEREYLRHSMQMTREAYNIHNIIPYEFADVVPVTREIMDRNADTRNNIRVVDYKATLDSTKQLQSNTNFYTFVDGDIYTHNIKGKDTPIFVMAREINKDNLPEKSYTNTMFRYTHGYGIAISPINRFTAQGQTDFILSGIELDSRDNGITVTEPRIYYGELTDDYVVVNRPGSGKIKEIDADGYSETNYEGNGGLKMSFFNRLLFAIEYGDINMLISGNIDSESRILLNRHIYQRAQKAVPFLIVDRDAYIVLSDEGRLNWILDAYTTTPFYPYAEYYSSGEEYNYIRNSVKIVVDAYHGTVDYYIIDQSDPIIMTYDKIYPGVFRLDPLPSDIASHMKYPEALFDIQSVVMRRYHLEPDKDENVRTFYSNNDLWNIATIPIESTHSTQALEAYYNLVKLPGELGTKEELILMLPYTPSGGRHNLASWLAVRCSYEDYGQMILFTFPKNKNIFGPYQVEVKINQIDSIAKDISLWSQGGSEVFKGNLLVIPIEESVLYVEPIYIKSSPQAIPEVRLIVVGYQQENWFIYGIGTNLDRALEDLYKNAADQVAIDDLDGDGSHAGGDGPGQATGGDGSTPRPGTSGTDPDRDKIIDDISKKYDEMQRLLGEIGDLIDDLR